MKIELSRNITKRVRGLHRAIKLHNRDGHYYGSDYLVHNACVFAKKSDYSMSRGTIKNARRYGLPTLKSQAQVNGKHLKAIGSAGYVGETGPDHASMDAKMAKRAAINTMVGKFADTPLLDIEMSYKGEKVTHETMNVNEVFGKMGRKPELIKCELSKKFLAAVKAPAIPTEHMWMRDQLDNMAKEVNHELYVVNDSSISPSRETILRAGLNKIEKALEAN